VFDCGTSASGKKKACKDCSCGLAEELEAGQEVKKKTPEQASSCGSVRPPSFSTRVTFI
jgi:hypothetical protein